MKNKHTEYQGETVLKRIPPVLVGFDKIKAWMKIRENPNRANLYLQAMTRKGETYYILIGKPVNIKITPGRMTFDDNIYKPLGDRTITHMVCLNNKGKTAAVASLVTYRYLRLGDTLQFSL